MAQLFRPVDPSVSFPELETGILDFWRANNIFQRSIDERPEDNLFVFYEGPPTANGRPGVHHIMPRVIKDLFARYKTMRGYRVPRKAGWDTHGLPVEIEVEKELGLNSKPEIEAYGIDKFNAKCRESVNRYVGDFEKLTERIAFWADMDNPYVTYDNDYIESGWWIFKQLWEHGLVYQDYRSTPHCPRCETSLSDHELSQGYRDDVSDPSVFIKFRLTGRVVRARIELSERSTVSMVAWTTTPWTLPGNTALAVMEDATYGLYEHEGRATSSLRKRSPRACWARSAVLRTLPGLGAGRRLSTNPSTAPRSILPDGNGRAETYSPGVRQNMFVASMATCVSGMSGGDGEETESLALPRHRRRPRLARRRHGHRAHRPRLRWRGLRGRQAARPPLRPACRLPRDDGRGPARRRPLRQGRRRGHPRPKGARPDAPQRAHPPHLPLLLALRFTPALLRQAELVHPHHRPARPPAGGQRPHQLAARPHQARALRQLAREQRRLGRQPRALLGHAPPLLGLRRVREGHGHRLAGGTGRPRPRSHQGRGARRPPPPLHRRHPSPLRR